MATTYDPIATTTLGSAASSITFSSIPSTYTDLRLVFVGITTDTASYNLNFNSNTSGGLYSQTSIYGSGSGAVSTSASSTNQIYVLGLANATSNTLPSFTTIDIFSYAGSTYKTSLLTVAADKNNTQGEVWRTVGLWRNTSAITTVTLTTPSLTFQTGATATLYGIKSA